MLASIEEFLAGKYVLAGTGSRSLITESTKRQEDIYNELYFKVIDIAGTTELPLVIMSGMSEGFDEILPRVAVELDLPYVCCVPTPNYGSYYWKEHSLTGENRYEVFESLLEGASYVEYTMEKLYDSDGLHANLVRNNRMTELGCEFVVYNPTTKGTKHCLKQIRIAKKPYHILGESN